MEVRGQVEHALEEGLRQEDHLDALGQLPLPEQHPRVGVKVPHSGELLAETATEEQDEQPADLNQVPLVVHHPLGSPQDLQGVNSTLDWAGRKLVTPVELIHRVYFEYFHI